MNRMTGRSGFTLAEVLVALVFLAVLVPAVLKALSISNRASVLSTRNAIAMQLAENELNDLLLNDAWSSGSNQGDFGADYPGYRWELQSASWPQDTNMTELTMTVHFEVQSRDYTAQLDTLATTSAASDSSGTTTP